MWLSGCPNFHPTFNTTGPMNSGCFFHSQDVMAKDSFPSILRSGFSKNTSKISIQNLLNTTHVSWNGGGILRRWFLFSQLFQNPWDSFRVHLADLRNTDSRGQPYLTNLLVLSYSLSLHEFAWNNTNGDNQSECRFLCSLVHPCFFRFIHRIIHETRRMVTERHWKTANWHNMTRLLVQLNQAPNHVNTNMEP